MDRKIRVGAVSYLNTKPLIYGFEHGMMKDEIELVVDYPSKIAAMLLSDEIDLGLVPVAIIPSMKEYHIVGNHCISSDGPVASVCLFSEVPLNEIETVLLDYQSRTSVELARILMKEYWQIKPALQPAGKSFETSIKGKTAAVLIGDRALEQRNKSKYVYDLGEAWKKFTGLPFVYAMWLSNKMLSEKFVADFDNANKPGLENIKRIVSEAAYDVYDLNLYYQENIQFELTDNKLAGLQRFLSSMG